MLSVKERLAEKYAMAIFEIAEQENMLDTMQQELEAVQDFFIQQPQARIFIENILVPKGAKKDFLKQVLSEQIHVLLLQLLLVLVDKGRTTILTEVIDSYKRLLNERRNIVEIKVTTARELDANMYERIAEHVGKLLDKKVLLHKKIDEKLIGGIVIGYGDKLIDGSVLRQLKNMEYTLKSIDVREIGVTN